MKFLVLAADAQSGAGAGSKGDGALTMACDNDPALVETQVCREVILRLGIKPAVWYE